MRTRRLCAGIIAAVMIISCSFLLTGCGQKMSVEEFEKKKAEQGEHVPLPGESVSLERFVYEFSNIMAVTRHRVEIRLLDNEYWYSTDGQTYTKLSESQREKFFDMIDRYKLYSTKDNRTGYFEIDGFDFGIEYELTDGTKAFDSGQVVDLTDGYLIMDEFDELFSMGYHVK